MKLSYRVFPAAWESDYHFNNLYTLLSKYRSYIDEIALFVFTGHTCSKIEDVEYYAKIGKIRIKAIKELGISCGFNHLCTIGHINENLKNSLDFDNYDLLKDRLGNQPKVLCMNSEKTHEYDRKVYTALAKAEPDFIWTDDDVRLTGHSAGNYSCFCPICMKKFGDEIGVENLDYEGFRKLTDGNAPDFMKYRKKWLEFNEKTVNSIFKIIRETVDEVNPNIQIGIMSAYHCYANDGFKTFIDTLKGKNNIPVKMRPGAGCYKDYDRREVYAKSVALGRMAEQYIDYVDDIQSEIENFPYNMLHKSSKVNMLETCSYIGVGCTGVAYNVLFSSGVNSKHNDNFDNETKFKDLLPYKPFYTALCDTFGKNLNRGVCLFEDNLTQMLSNHSKEGEWLEGMPWGGQLEFYEMGIPMAFRNASVTMLMRDNFREMPDEEIMKILSGGVILSGVALIALCEMGYGEYLGFKLGKNIDFDAIERMTDHEFNEEAEGMMRDNHQSFWWDTAYGFVKTNEKAQVVATLVDYAENVYKDDEGNDLCSVGVFENSLGGRVCVMGYYKDSHLHSYPKCRQIKNILKYVSKNTVSYIDSYHSIYLYDRSGEKAAFLAVNNSFDDAENVILKVAKDVEKLTIVYKDMSEKVVLRLKVVEGYSVFDLGCVASFDPILIKE